MKKEMKKVIAQNSATKAGITAYRKHRYVTTSPQEIDERMIVFEVRNGRIDGSELDMLERNLRKDNRFSAYTKVWVVENPDKCKSIAKRKKNMVVKRGSSEYYKCYRKAKYWVSDNLCDRWLEPAQEQIVIMLGNTVSPIAGDIYARYGQYLTEKDNKEQCLDKISYFVFQNEIYKNAFLKELNIQDMSEKLKSRFLILGNAQQDYFFSKTEDGVEIIKDKLDIMPGKKTVLVSFGRNNNRKIDYIKLSEQLGSEYTLLLNIPELKQEEIPEKLSENVKAVNGKESMIHLLAVSDFLITDISKQVVDYAILEKPMICFETQESREDIQEILIPEEELPVVMIDSEDKLSGIIQKLEAEPQELSDKTRKFNEKYNANADGKVSERIIEQCFEHSFSERYTELMREEAKNMMETRKSKYKAFCETEDIDEKKVVFEAFAGDKYACNPKAIYEELLKDERYSDFEFVWIANKPEDFKELLSNPNTSIVKKFTNAHYKAYASSKYWVNNMSVAEYLTPREGQVYIETWHGVPLKRMGFDIETDVDPRQSKSDMLRKYEEKAKKFTYMLSSSPFYTEKLTSAFAIDKYASTDIFVNTGYPRNDFLYNYKEEQRQEILEKLNLPLDKKYILYAPTWRDTQYENGKIVYQVALNFEKFMNRLPEDYVLLFRAHHHVKSVNSDNAEMSNVINVADVPDINDLYVISDLLITDYSSTMFDYAILKRPMVFYMYDLQDYGENVRGFYFDINEIPGPIVQKEEEVADAVLELLNNFQYDEKYQKFNEKFNTYNSGHSSKNVIDTCFTNKVSDNYLELKEKRNERINEEREKANLEKIRKYNLKALLYETHIKSDKNSSMLMDLKGKYKGKRCFLVGNGPSLTVDQLDLIKDEYSFGCNMIYNIFDQTEWRPSFYCCIDSLYATSIGSELLKMGREIPVITVKTSYDKVKKRPKRMMYVNNVFSENNYQVRGNLLAYCKTKATVMTLMAEAAFYMGFSEIYFIGVDNSDTHGTGGHFYNDSHQKQVAMQDINRIKKRLKKNDITMEDIEEHTMNRCNSVYEELKKYADKHGIKMYNATRGGKLEVYQRVNLEEVVKR